MTDEEAIVAEGMTLADFPPLEYTFDIVVNDFMPNPLGTMVGETTMPFSSTSAASAPVTLSDTWIFDFTSFASAQNPVFASHSYTFNFNNDSVIQALATLSHGSLIDFSSSSSAFAYIGLTEDYVFDFASTSTTTVSVGLSQNWIFEVNQDVSTAVLSDVNHNYTFDIASASVVQALATLRHTSQIGFTSSSNTSVLVTLSQDHVFQFKQVAFAGRTLILKGAATLGFTSYAELKKGDPVIEANVPIWPFEPNWNSTLTETLEWLTDVMTSPTGSEQRRSLREMPRRTFEYTMIAASEERSLFDNMSMTYSARKVYLPLWHDVNFIDEKIVPGTVFIKCSTASESKILPTSAAVLIGDSAYDNELIEIDEVTADGFYLATGVKGTWPVDTRIYPAHKAGFTDQPEAAKQSDNTITAGIRFRILQADKTPILPVVADRYKNYIVLSDPPDERSPLSASIERMLVELDNQTSIPRWRDTANRPFTYEQYAWVLDGREELAWFENLLLTLRGRSQPIWVPTFMEDMVLAKPALTGAEAITVERCGFTLTGGPRPEREYVMIETLTGRIYRRIVASAFNVAGQEVIAFDTPLGVAITPDDIVRICFMNLMRLNQDNVVIEHQTDTDGVATALAIFRSAPDTRIPEEAPF